MARGGLVVSDDPPRRDSRARQRPRQLIRAIYGAQYGPGNAFPRNATIKPA